MKKYIKICFIIFFIAVSHTHINPAEKQLEPIKFIHENVDNINLVILRDRFSFDEYISKGKNEYEKMILLKDWVFQNLTYKKDFTHHSLKNALKILVLQNSGESFLCTNFSAVYMQCALSMGWSSRYFFLRNPKGNQHACNDIWSNKYKKWIFIDASWNIHIEKNGIPLSLFEIRNEWLQNNGRYITFIFGAGNRKKNYSYYNLPIMRRDNYLWRSIPITKTWISYFYQIAMLGRNNFFTHKKGDSRDIWDLMYIIKDHHNSNDSGWAFRGRTAVKDMNTLFHKLNNVSVSIDHYKSKDNSIYLKLKLNGKYNYTPNFKDYKISSSDGTIFIKKNFYRWKVKKGKNTIKLQVRNKSDVLGPVVIFSVEYPLSH